MSQFFKLSITGDKEIDNAFKYMTQELSHKTLQAAHAEAGKIVVIKEKLLAPEGPTGNLVDSIGATKVPLKRASVIGEVHVGPRRKGGYKGYIGHIIEYGTKERYTTGKKSIKAGARRGFIKAHPFAKPAFDQTKVAVERQIGLSVSKAVKRAIRRAIK